MAPFTPLSFIRKTRNFQPFKGTSSGLDESGNWILSDENDVREYTQWLVNKSGAEEEQIIRDLENRILFDNNSSDVQLAIELALQEVPIKCSKCGAQVTYAASHQLTTKTPVNEKSRVLSRSLTGTTMAREVTTTYSVHSYRLCEKCYKKHQRRMVLQWVILFLTVAIIVGLVYCFTR